MDDTWRAQILEPPLQTAELPGTGGRIRRRPEDFVVDEIAAYESDGTTGAHALVSMTKRELSSEEAIECVAQHLSVARRDLGMAGRKDRVAVTTQWISVPWAAHQRLASFEHPQISLGTPQPHSNKLRTGHLHGNRFTLVLRELAVSPQQAATRVEAIAAALVQQGGLANFYGPQRFGREGHQLDRGLDSLRRGHGGKRGNLVVGAGQSALFNLTALLRRDRQQWRTILAGDLLRKQQTGGMFECTDPATDQARLDAGELHITGPMFGSRMRGPSPGTPSAQLEADALAMAAVEPSALLALGRKASGTRRPLTVALDSIEAEPVPDDELGPGLRVRFALPSGSYATQLLREFMGDERHPADIRPD